MYKYVVGHYKNRIQNIKKDKNETFSISDFEYIYWIMLLSK